MIRPIDNQILYLQTVELSHRQQSLNKTQDLQQQQFSDIINKEMKEKQETVKKTPLTEKVANNLQKENQSKKQKKFKPKEVQKKQKQVPEEHQGLDLKI